MVSRFSKDNRGAVLPVFGVMVIMVVLIAGIAVDVSRTVNAREKMSYALDAAALAAASELSTTEMTNDEIKAALAASFKANLSDAEFLDEAMKNISFVVDSDKGIITVSSSATLSNYFIDIGGYMKESLGPETFAFGTSSQVSYSRYDVELAMVVDVTGSMSSEMDSLRTASASVVNILIPEGTKPKDSKVRISLVPYSQGVNLGSYASAVTNGEASYQNCVNEREGTEKYTDAIYNYDGTASEFFHGTPDYFVRDYGYKESWKSGYDKCPGNELLPLTSTRSTLVDAIAGLNDGGGTGGQTGIAWGWYTLSPNWAPLWPTDSEPESYGDGNILKFALIMTDGDFNAEYSREDKKTCTYSGCETEERWVERYHMNSDFTDPPAERARELCDAMKKEGVKIYAVYFETGGSSFGADLMEYCSSGDDYYYKATSSEGLNIAFSNIAKKIQAIYLSK
ncbi:pilus assembly protein TadG-related protein [Roseibium sp.]|uniref:pilus assembly protein TadG-related protein n=1 Tax=Roseibium sp. TaxID=1936156 RepID=UPI003D13AFDE